MFRLLKKSLEVFLNEGIKVFLIKIQAKFKFVYQKVMFRSYIANVSIDGKPMKVLISDLFSKACYDSPQNLDAWKELYWIKSNILVEGDIVADCGANIGFTGLFFANCVGSTGKVIGFEALPSNAVVAKKNIELNKIKNFEMQNKALGSHVGTIKFIDEPNGSVGEMVGSKSIDVPMTTLDDFFSNEKPTFIKIDVEGYEIEVLKGAQNILQSKPKLDIEIHCSSFDNSIAKVSELLALVDLSAYKIYIQLTPNAEIVLYEEKSVNANLIAEYDNVHLFAIPL